MTGAMIADTYCSGEDVLAFLAAYHLDGDAASLASQVAALLPATKAAIDSAANRDFRFHAGDTILMDGSGDRVLFLGSTGTVPVEAVTAVAVGNTEVPADEWFVYAEEAALVMSTTATLLSRFPAGCQNVAVTLDWGYRVPPAAVAVAQAKLVAATLLSRPGGKRGSDASVEIGGYIIQFAGTGAFSYTIRRLVAEVAEAVGRYRRFDFEEDPQ